MVPIHSVPQSQFPFLPSLLAACLALMAHILPRSSFHYPPVFNYLFVIFSHLYSPFVPLILSLSNRKLYFLHFSLLMLQTGQTATSSLPSSTDKSSSSALHLQLKQGLESDEEIRRVPELGGESAVTSASRPDTSGGVVQGKGESRRKRGRSAADKETRRRKRLLRNRVSAQQARERKKAYLNDLETRVKDLEEKNTELEERLSTLQNENQMLRQILKNTTASRRGGSGGENE